MPALATGLVLAACSEQESGQTTPELAVEAVPEQIQTPADPDSGVATLECGGFRRRPPAAAAGVALRRPDRLRWPVRR